MYVDLTMIFPSLKFKIKQLMTSYIYIILWCCDVITLEVVKAISLCSFMWWKQLGCWDVQWCCPVPLEILPFHFIIFFRTNRTISVGKVPMNLISLGLLQLIHQIFIKHPLHAGYFIFISLLLCPYLEGGRGGKGMARWILRGFVPKWGSKKVSWLSAVRTWEQ